MEAMQPTSSKALQQWLFITYKKESKYFSWKKAKAMRQMEEAKDAVSIDGCFLYSDAPF